MLMASYENVFLLGRADSTSPFVNDQVGPNRGNYHRTHRTSHKKKTHENQSSPLLVNINARKWMKMGTHLSPEGGIYYGSSLEGKKGHLFM